MEKLNIKGLLKEAKYENAKKFFNLVKNAPKKIKNSANTFLENKTQKAIVDMTSPIRSQAAESIADVYAKNLKNFAAEFGKAISEELEKSVKAVEKQQKKKRFFS